MTSDLEKHLESLKNELLSIPGRDIGTHLELLLRTANRPLEKNTLVFYSPRWKPGQIAAALNGKRLFTRHGKTLYGLSDWGFPVYRSVSAGLNELLGTRDAVHMDEIYEFFEGSGVSQSSIRAYASTWPFKVESGWCMRRNSTEVPPLTSRQKRNFFVIDDSCVCLRLLIGEDHLRGSGFTGPKALAYWLGLTPGDYKHISLGGTAYQLSLGRQFHLGSLGAPLRQLGVAVGATVLLRFHDNTQSTAMELIAEPGLETRASSQDEIMVTIGRYDCVPCKLDRELLFGVVCEALDVRLTKWNLLVAEAKARGDQRLERALISLLVEGDI